MPPPNGGVRRGCLAYLSLAAAPGKIESTGSLFHSRWTGASGQRSTPWRLRRSLGIAPRQPRENRGGGFLEAAATSERAAQSSARRRATRPRSAAKSWRPPAGARATRIHRSTSATSARRRPGTAPRPEAARARASNSDVLQGEASMTRSPLRSALGTRPTRVAARRRHTARRRLYLAESPRSGLGVSSV